MSLAYSCISPELAIRYLVGTMNNGRECFFFFFFFNPLAWLKEKVKQMSILQLSQASSHV